MERFSQLKYAGKKRQHLFSKGTRFMKLTALLFFAGIAAGAASLDFIPADHPGLAYFDYARMELVDSPAQPAKKMARFDRIIDMPGRGYRWDNPGARLRFRTAAPAVTVHLYFNDKHTSKSARNANGIYLIDGKENPAWTFTATAKKTVREPEAVDVVLQVPPGGAAHDYDVVMPYGDSVDVVGLSVTSGAKVELPPPRSKVRCVMYGDSITHGFTASSIAGTYTFRTAQLKNVELIDMGLGGRASTPGDGAVLAKLNPSLVTVLIGVNDWQGGRPLESYRKNIAGFIKTFRAAQPTTPVYFITPLWVPPSWRPAKASIDLEEYRKALRETVAAAHDANLKIIEGPALIDHDPKLFDKVAVHPNDAGFKMMSERLAAALP